MRASFRIELKKISSKTTTSYGAVVETLRAVFFGEPYTKEPVDRYPVFAILRCQKIGRANKENAMPSFFHRFARVAFSAPAEFGSDHHLLVAFEDRAQFIEIVFVGDREWYWVCFSRLYFDELVFSETQWRFVHRENYIAFSVQSPTPYTFLPV